MVASRHRLKFSLDPQPMKRLLRCRLAGFKPNAWESLGAQEALWQNLNIYPVTVEITDSNGLLQIFEVDFRLKHIN
jgi:hypothetical protein